MKVICLVTENGCLPFKMVLVMLTTLPRVGSRVCRSQVRGVLNAFLPVSVLFCPALPTLVRPEGRLSFCSVLGQTLLWVSSEVRKELGWSQVFLSQRCFTWAECVFLQQRTSLLMTRGRRVFLWWWRGAWLGSCGMPVGQNPLHPSSERSLQAVLLDCSFHVYNLHQKNGFTCMLIGEIFELM